MAVVMEIDEQVLAAKFAAILPHLNRCRPMRQHRSPADATSVEWVIPSEGNQGDEWVA
jgi:hypothetical protein